LPKVLYLSILIRSRNPVTEGNTERQRDTEKRRHKQQTPGSGKVYSTEAWIHPQIKYKGKERMGQESIG
jgi:hypothetical protein